MGGSPRAWEQPLVVKVLSQCESFRFVIKPEQRPSVLGTPGLIRAPALRLGFLLPNSGLPPMNNKSNSEGWTLPAELPCAFELPEQFRQTLPPQVQEWLNSVQKRIERPDAWAHRGRSR